MVGYGESRTLLRRLMTGLFLLVGPFKIRVTVDTIMERVIPPTNKRDAGFRSTLRSLNSEDDIDDLIAVIFDQIENAIDHYHRNGMSGCRIGKIKSVRAMVVKTD